MNGKNAVLAAVAATLVFSATSAFADGSDQPVADTVITTKVKAKLIGDDTTKARHINVDTKNGVVTLKGTVGSATEKDKAAEDAQLIEGVASVDNQLLVKQK